MELFAASNQWFNRPDDERFPSLKAMYSACKSYADTARQSTFTFANSRTVPINGDVMLEGKTGVQAKLTHHAFGQLATNVGAPANYLRSLPADLACQNLNHGFKTDQTPRRGLFHVNGNLVCRCITSHQYERIWNYEVVERLMPLEEFGWHTPPSASDKPSGLYASDHDMFAFLVEDKNRIDDGTEEGLARGFFAINSEVGSSAFKLITFLYRFICGNHIVWGAENVQKLRIIHKGRPARNWNSTMKIELQRYADSSSKNEQAKIKRAKTLEIAASKDQVLDALFARRTLGITRKDLDASYDAAVLDYDETRGAPPNTVWGMVQGITRHSQTKPYADDRVKLDVAAGKVLEMAF